MPEKPPSFEEFKKMQEEQHRVADQVRSLEGMKKRGKPEQRQRAENLLKRYSKES